MHPVRPFDPPVFITYELGGRYTTVYARVALNDTSSGSRKPMAFAVSGDNRQIWKSRPISMPGQTDECKVSVKDIKKLTLQVTGDGDPYGLHGVWVEPSLEK